MTDPAFTERYWRHPASGGVSYRTDWQKGSAYDLAYDEVGLVVSDPEQVILEADPPRRLAYTWHTFTPEWAAAHGFDEATVGRLAERAALQGRLRHRAGGGGCGEADRRARRLRAGSAVLQGVRGGWPAVIASLKTLLETGSALPST